MGTADASPRPALKPGDQVTSERLRQVAPADFYWDLLRRQMERPVSLVTKAYFRTPSDFQTRLLYFVDQVGIDRRDDRRTVAQSTYQDGQVSSVSRCVGGKQYSTSRLSPGRRRVETGHSDCGPRSLPVRTSSTDGVVASGLSPDQAGRVIGRAARRVQGIRRAGRTDPGHSGRAAVRAADRGVQAEEARRRQVLGRTDLHLGLPGSGLDANTWPSSNGFGGGEGLRVAYYLDVRSLLPAGALQRTTPVLDSDGRVMRDYKQTAVYRYDFPSSLRPLTLHGTEPVAVSPPEGWRMV